MIDNYEYSLDIILPAVGKATRMQGLPKFLLPIDRDGTSLIERHIINMQDSVSRILIPTQQKFVELLEHLPNKYINVEILPLESQSMCETVLKTIQAKICQDIAIIMPDTFFSNTEVYKGIKHDKHDITVFCWQIQQNQKGKLGQVLIEGKLIKEVLDKDINCNFPNFWGAIKISNPYLKYISSSDAHFGVYMNRVIAENIDVHASISMGDYYDCGSPESYFDCIKYV